MDLITSKGNDGELVKSTFCSAVLTSVSIALPFHSMCLHTLLAGSRFRSSSFRERLEGEMLRLSVNDKRIE